MKHAKCYIPDCPRPQFVRRDVWYRRTAELDEQRWRGPKFRLLIRENHGHPQDGVST